MISRSFPVCTDHRKTSKESVDPAATTSPEGSTAKFEDCTGEGEVNVQKLRYRMRSYVSTVPSRGREENAAMFCECFTGDWGGVLGEGYKAEARMG